MGLFSELFGIGDTADEFCPVCGTKLPSAIVPFNGTKKLADGRICSGCAAQISPFVTGIKHMSVSQMAAHLQYRNENRSLLQLFSETHRIQEGGITIALDWNRQQILFSSAADYRSVNADVLSLSQITSVQYEINESHYTDTRDLKDGYGPRKIPVYTYVFHFNISVNHPWFDRIEFLVNNRTAVELTDQEILLDCIADGDNLYRFLSSIGFPSTFTDNTTCGVDCLRNGTAMNRLVPPPPPPQPVEQPAHDRMAMGVAAGVVMEQNRRQPRPVPAPDSEKRQSAPPAPSKQGIAESPRQPMNRGSEHRPANQQTPEEIHPRQQSDRPTGQPGQGQFRSGQPEQDNQKHPSAGSRPPQQTPSGTFEGRETGRTQQNNMGQKPAASSQSNRPEKKNSGSAVRSTGTASQASSTVSARKREQTSGQPATAGHASNSSGTGTSHSPAGRQQTSVQPGNAERGGKQNDGHSRPNGPMGGRGPGKR